MATDGMWVMTDEYEFELQEPYKTQLLECRLLATKAWRDAMLDYLEPRTQYTRDELRAGLMYRNEKADDGPVERVTCFILEALGGDL